MIPQDLRYTEKHEWIRVENGVGTVGISDHAQEAMGDITFVELPEVDTQVAQGDEVVTIESAKAAESVFAPVAGRVVEVNSEVEDAPEIVNESPYEKGWIFKIEVDDASQVEALMDSAAYEKFVEEESA